MNDRLNIIPIVIDKTYQFFDHKFLPDKQSDQQQQQQLN